MVIGADAFGNRVVLDLKGETAGGIYFWDHEDEAEGDAENYDRNIYFIARDFSDFIENLRPTKE